jgi:predicted phage-related endonuclease
VEGAEPYKEFIRQMTARIEHAVRSWERGADADRRLYVAHFESLHEETRAMREELRDLREESRAQTSALLAVLDRLNGGAEPAT